MTKFFIGSMAAWRYNIGEGIQVKTRPVLITSAKTKEDAEWRMKKMALDVWPATDGWSDQGGAVMEVEIDETCSFILKEPPIDLR